MNLKELKEILQMLEERDITEFELEEEGKKIRVRRAGAAQPQAAPAPPIVVSGAPVLAAAPGARAAASPPPAQTAPPAAPAPLPPEGRPRRAPWW